MKEFLQKFTNKYFGDEVDFRAKTFNLVMFIGLLNGMVLSPVVFYLARGDLGGRFGLLTPAITLITIWYANKSGKFEVFYWITTIVNRMFITGLGFLNNGGYGGGMLALFTINVATTAIIFRGKTAITVSFILLVEYIALCVYAYYNPDAVRHLGEREQFLFTLSSLFTACVSFITIMALYIKLHDRQKRELEAAQQKAVESEKLKTEFFTRMSHEYRTPLAVITASAQIADKHITAGNITNSTHDYLQSIKQEAMRLAGITNFTMASLRMPFESYGDESDEVSVIQNRFAPVYINDLARIMSDIVKLAATQNEIAVHVETEEDMQPIKGDRDTLIHLMLNLLHNAVTHANCKNIMVSAYRKDEHARLTIEDDGAGIPPALLKTIFNRGASGNGSKGMGLYVCDKIVFAHRGHINIENRRNGGTRVMISFPLPSV